MKQITTYNDQTVFDIAIQEMGSVEGVFELIDMNPELKLDLSFPAGMIVTIPKTVINAQVVDYYSRNNIKPVSGAGEEITLSDEDMTMITQDLEYDLINGDIEFPRVKLSNLREQLTVQIVYDGVTSSRVHLILDQSLDGENFSHVPESDFILNPLAPTHTYNVLGLLTNYVRACVHVEEPSEGIIHKIMWRV